MMTEKILQLQQSIYNYELKNFDTGEEQEYFVDYSPKICFAKVGELYEMSFYGGGFDEDPNTKALDFDYETNFSFCHFLDFLTEGDHAEKIVSLSFGGPDEGANGTKSWDFNRLINSNVKFPNLKSFKVQLTNLGDHNQSIIDGIDMEEGGMVAKLILKMPKLENLVVPSAPDKSFFEVGKHPLKRLITQAGYGHQNFIENLALSDNYYQLLTLDYSEVIDVYDMEKEKYTSFENFKKLFQSKGFSTIKHFKLRNSILTIEQLFELQRLNPVQFLYIATKGGRYVSHLMEKN